MVISMKKKEFLDQIRQRMDQRLPKGEMDQLLSYLAESIDDQMEEGMTEEQAVENLGDLDTVLAGEQDDAVAASQATETGKPSCKTFETLKAIHTAEFEGIDANLMVRLSQDNTLHLAYEEDQRDHYEITLEEGGDLKVRNAESPFKRMVHGLFPHKRKNFTVALPADFDGDLIISGTGRLDAQGVRGRTFEIHWVNGAVVASDLACRSTLRLKSSNGSIRTQNVVVAGEMEGKSTNGTIQLEKTTALSILAGSCNGTIQIKDCEGKESIRAKTTNGRIQVSAICVGKEIDLATTNGKISGMVQGRLSDYSIESRTTNGKNNLPGSYHGGEKHLSAKTTNGTIAIEFMENG